eukprot:15480365-Alexandrium_andersonii.AAC.1
MELCLACVPFDKKGWTRPRRAGGPRSIAAGQGTRAPLLEASAPDPWYECASSAQPPSPLRASRRGHASR